ncbi:hypothetical protein [uncultured Alistipes sp.]|uniref:hypothetical protein n=1 Tax=uncultured Alistipes sp. TaxID=538949 RepID=UPI0025924CF6|nr:hypothetical protein [uncultured Alistipes sp.]
MIFIGGVSKKVSNFTTPPHSCTGSENGIAGNPDRAENVFGVLSRRQGSPSKYSEFYDKVERKYQ